MDHNHNYFSHLAYNHATGKWNGPLRMWQGREQKDIPGYTTDVFGDLAVKYVNEHTGQKPFFMYLPWQAPHSPLQAPDAKYANDEEIAGVPKGTKPSMRGDYVKIVERLDYQVGRIMQALKKKGLDDNTLVVFTSDNGGHRTSRNLPLKGFKQGLDEGGIRVPMLMRWPGELPAAQVTSQMAITFDVTATVAALGGANISPDEPLDGIDLVKAVKTGDSGEDRTLYWRRRTFNTHKKVNKVRAKAIRKGRWKYIKDNAHKSEGLYNLQDDMTEKNNLFEQEPAKAKELIELLEKWEKDVSVV